MVSAKVFSAVVALGAGLASAQSTCTDEVRITEPTPVISCRVIDADVIIDEDLSGAVSIEGPEEILGDFRATNVSGLTSISSSTIESIEGVFELSSLDFLGSLDMQALRSLNEIRLIRLYQLPGLTFGSTGVTSATTVRISDTFISDLSGLNLATVENFQIDNNRELASFNSDLVNITGNFIVGSNANMMTINMTRLEMASEIQLSGVRSFDVPSLTTVERSLKFDKNPELESFEGNNITEIGESLTFINNKKLANVSFEALTTIGDMTIQNNTEITVLEGFPELETVNGGLVLAGNFESVDLPSINVVRGTATVTSTTDISDFCDFFDELESNGDIQGEVDCTSNNEDALENGEGGEENSDSDSDDDSDDEDDDNAAAGLTANMAMLSIAALAGLAQLL